MTKLRDSVELRSLEQKSPLNIYVEESDTAFDQLLSTTAHATLSSFLTYELPQVNEQCYQYLQILRKKRKTEVSNKG